MSKKRKFRVIRLSDALNAEIEKASRHRGFKSASAFIRASIEKDLNGEGKHDMQSEERVAASFDRISRELRKLGNAQQALFAFTDALARILLYWTATRIETAPFGDSNRSLNTCSQRVGLWLRMSIAGKAEAGSAGEQPAKEYSAGNSFR